jgi:hypothetical protein
MRLADHPIINFILLLFRYKQLPRFIMRKTVYTHKQAVQDNLQFDEHVKAFLRNWLSKGSPENADMESREQAIDDFVNGGALREYFKRHDDPFQNLLNNRLIAKHLCRPHQQVYFDAITHEPELSQFESRIYNLSAHRQHLQIPYRFIPISRQGSYGDRATNDELPPERQGKDNDIGDYFATRRADETVVQTMHSELKHAIRAGQMHVHLIDTHYMPDALNTVSEKIQAAFMAGQRKLEFFILQSRYRPEGMDRHFGAALLIMDPSNPQHPKRIIFCDTVNLPGWRPLFGTMINHVFGSDAEAIIEVASHPLQGLNREANIADHDINCSFYTRSMAYALLRLAQKQSQLLLLGTIEDIQKAMKGKMYDYYERNGNTKSGDVIKQTNLYKRWNIGHSMMLRLFRPNGAFMARV